MSAQSHIVQSISNPKPEFLTNELKCSKPVTPVIGKVHVNFGFVYGF